LCTTMANWMNRTVFTAALALAVTGCIRNAATSHESTAENVSLSAEAPATSEASQQATREKSARQSRLPQDAKPTDAPLVEKYVGPFPHRTNPFALPNADNAATAAKLRVTVKQAEERLLGFIDVDGRKALLQIDGQVWAARPGDSRNGIEVVDIAPAQVTLRRDGATWQLSLHEQNRSG
jgi:hypothetical protein